MDDLQRKALLEAYHLQTLAVLSLLNMFPDDDHRPTMRAALVQVLSAVEPALGKPRTLPSRNERRALRQTS
jgi:hypothetical protein